MSEEQATECLNEMNKLDTKRPWSLTFSYVERALLLLLLLELLLGVPLVLVLAEPRLEARLLLLLLPQYY